MIAEIFNSSLISGPETLVLPNLHLIHHPFCIIWLREERVDSEKNKSALAYFKKFADVHIIPITKRRDTHAAKLLREKLEELKVTVAHAHDVKASYVLHLSGVSKSYKRISTHHGVHARSLFTVLLYEQFYSRFILPKMDQTLVVCSTDKPILVSRGLAHEKITIHLNGVDRPMIPWEKRAIFQSEVRKEWKISHLNGEKIFGIVARLAKEKDHELALKVFARVRDLPFKVLCFGTGPEEEKLKKLTLELGLQDKVLWMGYRGTLGQELAGFDGLLSFSSAEGLPINLIEAGWAGTKVFARVVDGVSDLLPSKEFGFPFPKEATLEEIEKEFRSFCLDDGEKQARAFQKRVEKDFSGSSWAKKMDSIIEQLGNS